MDLDQIKAHLAAGEADAAEAAWMQAADAGEPAEDLAPALEAMVAAGAAEMAEVLAWTLLTARAEQSPPAEALAVAKAVLAAVPDSDELRAETAGLYRRCFGEHPRFEALLDAAALEADAAPRRALRTLDVGLAIEPGAYLAGRFEGRVLRAEGFDETLGEFELTDAAGLAVRMDPEILGNDYDLVGPDDFRVICQFRRDQLPALLADDPAAVMIGLCMSHGGRMDSVALKDALVPQHLPADQWARWWTRARTAAKRSEHLSLEGRHPVTVVHWPGGRTLEDELTAQADQAKMPLERLAVLTEYARQARQRKAEIDPDFVGPILGELADQARRFGAHRPADALAASLAISAATGSLHLPAPEGSWPTAEEVLASVADPAGAVAQLAEPALWTPALDALATRPDAPEQLANLLPQTPQQHLDLLAERLAACGAAQAVADAIARALAEPMRHLDLFGWLWQGPSGSPVDVPNKLELLSRLLQALQTLDKDFEPDPDFRKAARQRVRSVLASGDYAAFRQAVADMDTAVAGTIKNRIERLDGLGETVPGTMMDILRENFYGLFAAARVQPWEDEAIIWTSAAGRRRRQEALDDLVEVKIPANARAIGAAAEHGDLSENSEWRFAMEERDLLRARAARLQDEIARARVLAAADVPADSVGIGSRVYLRRLADAATVTLTFLGPWDSDPARDVLSYRAPLALDLMGRRVGETVELKLPGREGAYRIERLACGVGADVEGGSQADPPSNES